MRTMLQFFKARLSFDIDSLCNLIFQRSRQAGGEDDADGRKRRRLEGYRGDGHVDHQDCRRSLWTNQACHPGDQGYVGYIAVLILQ